MKIDFKHPGCGQRRRLAVWISSKENGHWHYGHVEFPRVDFVWTITCGLDDTSWTPYCYNCAQEMGLVW